MKKKSGSDKYRFGPGKPILHAMKVPFNIPCSLGSEPDLIRQAIENRHLSGNGPFTKKVHQVFEKEFGFNKVLLTNSCTAALEMAAYLCDFEEGDEVILPSFTHVSTANAFQRAAGKPCLRFADSLKAHPNIDPDEVRRLINPRTRAVVVVHYAGVACDMDAILEICRAHNLILIEDAAHAIGASWKGKPLGSIGDLGAFSFHETKNLGCGQGGLLMINKQRFEKRAMRLWQNGTNRAEFNRGDTDHYTWVDTGFCYMPSELNAAYLYGQLQQRQHIFRTRFRLWKLYQKSLEAFGTAHFEFPITGQSREHNGHIFYLRFSSKNLRDQLLEYLNGNGVNAVFHYITLHNSPYFRKNYQGKDLKNCIFHSNSILRLPLFHSLKEETIKKIISLVEKYFTSSPSINS